MGFLLSKKPFYAVIILLLFALVQDPATFSLEENQRHAASLTRSSLNLDAITTEDDNQTAPWAFISNILLSTRDIPYPHHVEPTLAVSDDGTLFVGYKNAETHNGGGARVSFTKSTDNGLHWTPPSDMPHFGGLNTRQSDPWMVWKNGTLYYAYLEYRTGFDELDPFSQITLARSEDAGAQWALSTASHGNQFADKETMAVSGDGNTVFVVYDDVGPSTDVRLSRSIDGGGTFQDISTISDIPHNGHVGPYIALDSQENLYTAWTWFNASNNLGDIYLDVSLDQGETFTTEWDVNPEADASAFEETFDGSTYRPAKVTLPVISFDAHDRLYLLWADLHEPYGTWDVYLRYSDNYGIDWSPRLLVNPFTPGNQWMPDMAIDSSGRVHIAWLNELSTGSYRPYYRNVLFGPDNQHEPQWSTVIPIANQWTPSNFTRPGDYLTIRVDSQDNPHVVWSDGRDGEMDIYYSHANVTTLPAEPSTNSTQSTIPVPSASTSSASLTAESEASSAPGFTLALLLGVFFAVMTVRRAKQHFKSRAAP
ncbi:MAG: sialidase family protein [Candidatus Thorarchaeota archaeon]